MRTLIEIGGEDCKYISTAQSLVRDFALNSVCAAGTGSFLDQQAERMGLTIEQFSPDGRTNAPPRPTSAGRCSVFAKSDMIHLQQIATPVADIAAGLCLAVARNYKGCVVRNRPMEPEVAFLGGVLRETRALSGPCSGEFGLDNLLVPELAAQTGALGAALAAQAAGTLQPLNLSRLKQASRPALLASGRAPLGPIPPDVRSRHVPPVCAGR